MRNTTTALKLGATDMWPQHRRRWWRWVQDGSLYYHCRSPRLSRPDYFQNFKGKLTPTFWCIRCQKFIYCTDANTAYFQQTTRTQPDADRQLLSLMVQFRSSVITEHCLEVLEVRCAVGCLQWRRHAWVWRLASPWNTLIKNRGELCEIVKFWSFLQSKSVNSVIQTASASTGLRSPDPPALRPWTSTENFCLQTPWAVVLSKWKFLAPPGIPGIPGCLLVWCGPQTSTSTLSDNDRNNRKFIRSF